MKRWFLLGLTVSLAGCTDDVGNGELYLVTGLESDTWSASPSPVTIEVERELADGTREPVTNLKVPAADEIPKLELKGSVSRFEAVGADEDGNEVVRGRSFWLDPSGLQGIRVPLFMSRVGEFSRPGTLADAVGDDPVVAIIGGRFLLVGGADLEDEVRMSGFDFGFWAPSTSEYYSCSSDSCRAESVGVVANSVALVIGHDWGYARDFVTNYGGTYALPDGLDAWSDVAGGASVQVIDGSAYIVGSTRTEPATDKILRLTAEGEVEVVQLGSERAGAAAVWVDDRGLLVVGGNEEAPGAELLPPSTGTPNNLAFAPDPTTGAALVAFDQDQVMRVGGKLPDGSDAPTVVFDLTCSEGCEPSRFGEPVGLDRAQAFHLDDIVLVVGEDSDGLTAARLVTETDVETVSLREPRSGARAIRNALDQVLVVGGTLEDGSSAYSVELFTR